MPSSVHISPTAHYTGEVWRRQGLSDPRLATLNGRAFYTALKAPMSLSQRLGGPTLEAFLLARHRLIDHRLSEAIERGEISQVIELASGLSPRGLRFSRRYGSALTYVETDLPGMARLKAQRLGLDDTGSHRMVVVDALKSSGEASLSALCDQLSPDAGTAIISEGLINYFPQDLVVQLWNNLSRVLNRFAAGLYLSDIHCRANNSGPLVDAFVAGLSVFVRGKVGLLFDDADDAVANLQASGFRESNLLKPSEWSATVADCGNPWADLVNIVEART